MFQAPFSFEGRIRRTEYGISTIIYVVVITIASLITQSAGSSGSFVMLLVYIPSLWFLWAQGAKRCHDLGKGGAWQLIPLYSLWLLFQDGEIGENGYGLNPKGIGNEESYESQINKIGKSLE